MPNNREWAMLVWLVIPLVGAILTNKEARSSLAGVLRMLLQRAIAIPILLLLGWIFLEVFLGYQIGLWRSDLTTDFIMWILVSGIVLFFSFKKASTQRHFLRRSALQTLGIAEIIQFLTNMFVMDLWVELILVPIISLVVISATVAERDPRHAPARRLLQGILTLFGIVLLAFSFQQLIANWDTMDWTATGRKFLLPIFLTVYLLPFVYMISLYAAYESAFKRMDFFRRSGRVPASAKIAVVSVLHFRARQIGALRSPWVNQLAAQTTFADSRRLTKDFQRDFDTSERAAIEKKSNLRRFAGSHDTDSNGRRLDRREFDETMRTLEWIAECQAGWYRNDDQDQRYRIDLVEILGTSFLNRGLPDEPGINLEVSDDGQSWYAWRRTLTGWCFAIGAAGPPPGRWKYDGPEPPGGFPSEQTNWANEETGNGVAVNWTRDSPTP